MEIKICGITNSEDALFAAACGVDALGFIFYPPSPRAVTPDSARSIIYSLPKNIVKVGVFVNHDPGEVKRVFDFCGLDLIQLHGDESADYCRKFPLSILIKAVSPQNESDIRALSLLPVKTILLDARDGGLYGGTGKKSNWGFASEIKKLFPLVLSGGLNGENIEEAIFQVSPGAVDINSGVESAPGKKDKIKIRNILEIIRRNDNKKGDGKIFAPNN